MVLGRLSSTSIPAIPWRTDIRFSLHGDQAAQVPIAHLERSKAEVMVGSRDEAVNAYGEWLEVLLGHREATSTPAVLRWLARLTVDELEAREQAVRWQLNDLYQLAIKGTLELECFCVPQRCHGEHVKRVLESVLQARGFAVALSKILA